MKILVCIKVVPDMESRFKPSADGAWFDEADLAWRMNEYDEYAVEEGVRLKEKLGGDTDVTVLSIGPERVKEVVKKALAMGCDRAVHVHDDASHKKDSFEIASLIHSFAKDKGFEVVFTGMQSQDRGSAQVGVYLAGLLGIACVTTIVEFALADGAASVKREFEGGVKAEVKSSLPALFTCQLGLNTPRYPTLPNIMKAKKKELNTVAVADLQKADALAATEKVFIPEKKGGAQILEGEPAELADKLIAILKEKTTVVK